MTTIHSHRISLILIDFRGILALDIWAETLYNMSMKNKIIVILIGLIALATCSYATKQLVDLNQRVKQAENADKLQRQLAYYREAERINDYYSRKGTMTRVVVIRDTLEAIDNYLPKYFPEGPYSRNDLIAMAMIESEFDQYLVGSHKEFGVFQIMPEACKDAGVKRNQFDIKVNTELALLVLSQKYAAHPDYRIAMIAYNGLVKKDGKLSQVYWKRFIKARKVVDDLFSDSYIPTR